MFGRSRTVRARASWERQTQKTELQVFIFTTASRGSVSLRGEARCAFEGSREFMYLCEVYLFFDLPTLWGGLDGGVSMPPSSYFSTDSHLKTYWLILLRVWESTNICEGVCCGVCLRVCLESDTCRGIAAGLMQGAGSGPGPLKNNII